MQSADQHELTVQDYPGNSSPVAQLSRAMMERCSIPARSYVTIKGLREEPTICLALPGDDDLSENSVRLGLPVRGNLKVTVGDQVKVLPTGNVPKGRKLRLLPMFGTSELETYPGLMLDTYLLPFFRRGDFAVRKNDYFTIGGGFGDIEFKILDTSPGDTIRVTSDTTIECQQDPDGAAARQDRESRSMFLYIQTQKAKTREEVKATDSIADLKRSFAQRPFTGAVLVGGKLYEDNSMQLAVFPPESVIRFVPLLALTLATVSGPRIQFSLYANQPISVVRQIGGEHVSLKDVFYCGSKLLKEEVSFDFEKIAINAEIRAVRQLTFTVTTEQGKFTIPCTSEDSFQKVKVEAIVAAQLNVQGEYQLMVGSEVIVEKRRVGLIQDSSTLILVALPKKKKHVGVQEAAVAMSMQQLVPEVQMIATNTPVQTLLKRGFQEKNILDPIQFYFMFLQYGEFGAASPPSFLSVLTLQVEVVSWGQLSIEVTAGDTVLQLKQRIAQDIKIPSQNQALYFCGKALRDSNNLLFYGIGDKDVVRLICSGRNAYFLIPSERFDADGDNDFTHSGPEGEKRGGEPYYPPIGWRRYGLKVTGLFESDIWLEWRMPRGSG